MTNVEFELKFKELVKTERKITNEILKSILEAEDRRLHLERGFSSLFDWLVKGVGYSEGAAARRIDSARMLRAVPVAAQKLERGEITLTTLAQAKSAMKAHTKKTGKRFSRTEQEELVADISNKTSREVQEALFERFPETASTVHQERRVAISEEITRLSFNLDKRAMADLEWVKNFISHSIPDGEVSQIFARLLREFRKREEAKGDRAVAKQNNSVTENRRVKPSNYRAKVVTLHRVERTCEFIDPVTGRVCGSSFMVEVDHIRPRALGGPDRLDNYRCLCRAHNQLVAEQKLGEFYRLHSRTRSRAEP